MTLADGKRKVYMLIDEYSSGGLVTEDADIEAKMADFFDIAQKELAQFCRIPRSETVERVPGKTEYELPADLFRLVRVWRDGKPYRGYRFKAGKLIIPERDAAEWEIEYFALPQTINADTPGDYEFEIPENAAQAMPFYVAAQQLIVDLVMDYSALYMIYQQKLQALMSTSDGTNGGLVNVLYR